MTMTDRSLRISSILGVLFILVGLNQMLFANSLSEIPPSDLQPKLNLIQDQEVHKDFQQINQDFTIYFFYMGSCPHCEKTAPILRNFANQYGFKMQGISLDGEANPNFPNSWVDINQIRESASLFEVSSVPDIFLVNLKTKQGFEVVKGEVDSLSDMTNLFLKAGESVKASQFSKSAPANQDVSVPPHKNASEDSSFGEFQ